MPFTEFIPCDIGAAGRPGGGPVAAEKPGGAPIAPPLLGYAPGDKGD